MAFVMVKNYGWLLSAALEEDYVTCSYMLALENGVAAQREKSNVH